MTIDIAISTRPQTNVFCVGDDDMVSDPLNETMIKPGRASTIIVDDDLGAVEVVKPANDTVRLDADELRRRIAELDNDNSDPFAA